MNPSEGDDVRRPPDETGDARRNRQHTELVNELRVALPGVQMLFGFLLAVPFSQRFADVSPNQCGLYYTAFAAAAGASVCVIAPTAFHRIVWQHGQKGVLLRVSSGLGSPARRCSSPHSSCSGTPCPSRCACGTCPNALGATPP